MTSLAASVGAPADLSPALDEFIAVVETSTELSRYPHSSTVEQNVVVYDADDLRTALADDHDADSGGSTATAVRREVADVLDQGPGILVIKGAFEPSLIDRATEAFEAIIFEEKQAGMGAGDHYAKPGANDRVWNALEKLAVSDPGVFIDYYANDMVALGALAWLGPNYQMSSQVNVVNPGGEAQQPHRDYHLGFMTDALAGQYPAHCHRLSPVLTLQGAVAHCDMPVETGPTMYLPHSQKYLPGYLAWRRPDFVDYFDRHRIQLPLAKGDVVFFNPALFHAAGSNHTADVRRMANLLQVSSAFSRTMETIDTLRMTKAVYPALVAAADAGTPATGIDNAIAVCAEGYAFPTNLDRDPPVGGLTPPSQQDIVREALGARISIGELIGRLEAHRLRQQSTDRTA